VASSSISSLLAQLICSVWWFRLDVDECDQTVSKKVRKFVQLSVGKRTAQSEAQTVPAD